MGQVVLALAYFLGMVLCFVVEFFDQAFIRDAWILLPPASLGKVDRGPCSNRLNYLSLRYWHCLELTHRVPLLQLPRSGSRFCPQTRNHLPL